MLSTVFSALRAQCNAWHAEADRRRAISTTDPIADTLTWCADELAKEVHHLESESEWLTPEDYGAQQIPTVSGQTVRNWIRRGELQAEQTPRGYRIARRTQRYRKLRMAS